MLNANYSPSGSSSSGHFLQRSSSSTPAYYSLPYYDDFSNPNIGRHIFDNDMYSAGYESAYYFVISKTTKFSSFRAVGRFFGDTVIEVDATPVSAPANNYFSYNIGYRTHSNSDWYYSRLVRTAILQ